MKASSTVRAPHRQREREHKRIRVPTPSYLENVALHYLERFAASEASLRRVLHLKLRRAALAHPDFAADRQAQENLRLVIETIIEGHKKTGAINDAAYAAMKTASLRRTGKSAKQIREKLNSKGIARPLIEQAIHPEDDPTPQETEQAAAQTFARRRKLGPWGRKPSLGEEDSFQEKERHRKELAKMLRAGFSFSTASAVLDLHDPDADPNADPDPESYDDPAALQT